jgi:hypothetical protein
MSENGWPTPIISTADDQNSISLNPSYTLLYVWERVS